jgi:urease accessory protein
VHTVVGITIITSINAMHENHDTLASLRLWQLISPALPVGAYAYSQGLEYALHAEWLKNAEDVEQWISGQLKNNLACLDIPVLSRLYVAWQNNDVASVNHWSTFILAARESRELVDEDLHLGRALATLLANLDIEVAKEYTTSNAAPFVNLLALAAVKWQIDMESIMKAYLWMWCENQVAAAIKLVPLGQTIGQQMLMRLADVIPSAAETGVKLEDDEIGSLAPGLGIASALHETQYSRLFRS